MSTSPSIGETSLASTSTVKKWKRMGMTSAQNAGSGFASMMRSAASKSSESLRSFRSSTSRRSTKDRSSNGATIQDSKAPPVPALQKPLPASPLPSTPSNDPVHRKSASSDVSRVIQEEADEAEQPYDLYDLDVNLHATAAVPPSRDDTKTPTKSRQDTVVTPTQSSTTTQLVTTSTTASSPSDQKSDPASRLRSVFGSSSSKTNLQEDGAKSVRGPMSSDNSLSAQIPFASASPTSTRPATGGANMAAGTQWAGEKVGGGDGNTIAQLYAVFGLPKDPAVWTLAEEDCIAGVHHTEGAVGRFWRPEVLGCSICPSPADVLNNKETTDEESGASKWSGRDAGGKKPSNPKFIEMTDGRGGVEKTETARVLSKALKLSFTREIEIIAEQGNYPPLATSHTFSFSVPTSSASSDRGGLSLDGRKAAGAVGVSVGKANAASGVGEGFGLENRAKVQGASGADRDDGPSLATFYGVVLTVWSAADEKRAKTIRKELARAAKQRSGASTTTTPKSRKGGPGGSAGWTGSEANPADEDDDRVTSPSMQNFSSSTTFFMPYAICIVSRYPLYNLLGDWNKMAWHKYSRNIEMHNQLMSTILRHPAPRLGERFTVGSPDKDLSFHCTFPGAMEWGTGLIGTDLTMWPLFKTLSLDNILTICEVALAPNGRVLFQSRHPALLGLAVETIKFLIEMSGWRGVANQNCHARDVKIYLEDPGSWIIAINTELRSIIKPAPQVCLVDLDINFVNCARPPLGAVSTRQAREKKKRRLMQVLFVSNTDCSPPREFIDAYPGGRFRPLSSTVTRDSNSAYEQLASPTWWNQVATVQAFDKVLREGQKPTFLKKVLKSRNSKANNISEAELAAILALRKRASTFVDARDGLENKIGRLNKRLAFLMSESDMWRAQFGKIQLLVDRLTKEANDLRSKVDKERRESRRLSSTLAQRDIEQVQLQLQIKETESAREEAQAELVKMQRAMESLETEREAMMEEIRAVISGVGGVEDVSSSLSRLDFPLPSYNPLVRSESPTGSQVSMTPSQSADYILKARAMAEAKISEGRGRGPRGSSNGHIRSLSQDRGERQRKEPTMSAAQSTTSHVNHFPDDQMNYEIQQRTSVVTSQISRIQAQLENTLTQLEGRRSGTYDREMERRQLRGRRSSNTSLHSRYEYRTGSSLGHGNGGGASSIGHGSEDGRSDIYEPIESVRAEGVSPVRRRRETNSSLHGSNGPPLSASSGTNGAIFNNALHSPTAVSPTAVSPTTKSIPGSKTMPLLQPKSQAREAKNVNQWEQVPVDNAVQSTDAEQTKTKAEPAYSSEIMLAGQPASSMTTSSSLPLSSATPAQDYTAP